MTDPALTSPDDLIRAGLAPAAAREVLMAVALDFRIRVTPEMHHAMGNGPGDPVVAQFVPTAAERITRPEERTDPIGDRVHSPVPGLTHRYPDRVILHVTQTCDVYCRFCFRRETVGADGPLSPAALTEALAYIAATPAVREVILTGGDPMTLSPRRLNALMGDLAAIPHLDVIRLHSRVPVVAPQRITAEMTAALARHPATFVVVHTNHAQELTAAAREALARLAQAGIPLLSQSVLLKGINDDADTLATLFRTLTAARVKPYYLHHCDLARGTGHFRTTIAAGQALMAALRGRLSGIAIPTYVLDIPGGYGKVPVTADHITPTGTPGLYRVRDWQGGLHDYADPTAS